MSHAVYGEILTWIQGNYLIFASIFFHPYSYSNFHVNCSKLLLIYLLLYALICIVTNTTHLTSKLYFPKFTSNPASAKTFVGVSLSSQTTHSWPLTTQYNAFYTFLLFSWGKLLLLCTSLWEAKSGWTSQQHGRQNIWLQQRYGKTWRLR